MKFDSLLNTVYPAHKFNLQIAFMLVGMMSLTSCVNLRKTSYFYNTQDTKFMSPNKNVESVLEKNDLLSITVSSINPEAAEIFNMTNASEARSSTISGTTAQVAGYLVDTDGDISFPVIGKMKAEGKTKKQLRDEIIFELEERKLLIEPIVDIRYLNFKVSVLGEVKNPAVMTIPDEKISLLEALGLAGDITVYGNRENVVLIREEDKGVKTLKRIDLTTNELFASPYYYLKSGDVIYVETNKNRVVSTSAFTQWIPLVISALSLAVISIASFK